MYFKCGCSETTHLYVRLWLCSHLVLAEGFFCSGVRQMASVDGSLLNQLAELLTLLHSTLTHSHRQYWWNYCLSSQYCDLLHFAVIYSAQKGALDQACDSVGNLLCSLFPQCVIVVNVDNNPFLSPPAKDDTAILSQSLWRSCTLLFPCLPWDSVTELIIGFLESSYSLQWCTLQVTKKVSAAWGIILRPPWNDQRSLIQLNRWHWHYHEACCIGNPSLWKPVWEPWWWMENMNVILCFVLLCGSLEEWLRSWYLGSSYWGLGLVSENMIHHQRAI